MTNKSEFTTPDDDDLDDIAALPTGCANVRALFRIHASVAASPAANAVAKSPVGPTMKLPQAGAARKRAAALRPSRIAITSKSLERKAGSITGSTKGSAELIEMDPPMHEMLDSGIRSRGRVYVRDTGVKRVTPGPLTRLSSP